MSNVRNSIVASVAAGMLGIVMSGCSSGAKTVPVPPAAPALALASVTVTCGAATVFGPAAVSANASYGIGSALPLTGSCPTGSIVAVSFTPSIAASSIGPNAELVFNLLPSANISGTAVAAADATSFAAATPQLDVPFTTPALGAGTYLYVWLTQLEQQGD
jgi:hypothetical protein